MLAGEDVAVVGSVRRSEYGSVLDEFANADASELDASKFLEVVVIPGEEVGEVKRDSVAFDGREVVESDDEADFKTASAGD
jgi:hypothetical protein